MQGTIPYKHDVIKYLDVLSESAKISGSVNTIINNNGLLHGYNTDFDGLNYLLEHHDIIFYLFCLFFSPMLVI